MKTFSISTRAIWPLFGGLAAVATLASLGSASADQPLPQAAARPQADAHLAVDSRTRPTCPRLPSCRGTPVVAALA